MRVTHAHLGPIWYHSEPSDIPYMFISPSTFSDFAFFAPPLLTFIPTSTFIREMKVTHLWATTEQMSITLNKLPYFNSYFQGWHQMCSEATVSNLAQSAPRSKSVKWLFYCNKTFPGNSQRSCTSSDKVEVVNFLFVFVFPQWSQCLFKVALY